MCEFKEVSKQEFYDFIENYDEELFSGCTMTCEPPIRSFRDESLPTNGEPGSAAYYFDKEVARIVMDQRGPGGQIDTGDTKQFWRYKIKSA